MRPRPSQSRALIPLSYRSVELAEAAGVEPAHAMRGDLANRCHTIRRRLHILGACGRTRTYEVVGRLIYSQVLLLLSHTCASEFEVSTACGSGRLTVANTNNDLRSTTRYRRWY